MDGQRGFQLGFEERGGFGNMGEGNREKGKFQVEATVTKST